MALEMPIFVGMEQALESASLLNRISSTEQRKRHKIKVYSDDIPNRVPDTSFIPIHLVPAHSVLRKYADGTASGELHYCRYFLDSLCVHRK